MSPLTWSYDGSLCSFSPTSSFQTCYCQFLQWLCTLLQSLQARTNKHFLLIFRKLFAEGFDLKELLEYRKIPNISPGLIKVRKPFFGGLYSGGLMFGGAYIRKAFCVSMFVSSLVKAITISMKYRYYKKKLSFFKQMSPLFCY